MNPLMVKIPVSLSKVDAYVVERFIAVTVSSVHSAPSVVHTPWRLEKKHPSPESRNITMKTVTGRGGALCSSDAMFEVCQDYFLTLKGTNSSKLYHKSVFLLNFFTLKGLSNVSLSPMAFLRRTSLVYQLKVSLATLKQTNKRVNLIMAGYSILNIALTKRYSHNMIWGYI